MLYIISTPIGNLKDITLRAIETLNKLDVLLCEDTRKTGFLLSELKIANKPKLVSFYDEVEAQKIPEIIKVLQDNLEVGLVTDAGTPLLSDPGWLLVKKCRELGISYTALPGACAVINAVVLSGLPIQRFSFLGFMPKREGDIKKILEKYKNVEGAKVLYESPLRAEKTFKLIKDVCGEDTEIRIVREMTKKFEEVTDVVGKEIKGEVVIIFS
ncbi:16S rRNA (cytidine(1402)-2'-O)-methyltransferase [Candidatus Shapirobacteria bacterium CG_4_9_14_3_um_filter_36_12]|uniref:16S rRNA (Cytidine(1402)-2'-O)-methyltransferase n=4 Tax=Candidatus Shapironibacteriota TaxID=1752721 RepID=A0A1J5HSQ9_9BACT|nr:MAG: 16S rRNA (cytidine(1402)-2'-O)-methyltransferase [Candidatus Shapirobacteria bacterium CG2_30_35_20]PIV06675.1 MAG: 16S rRNA (cytidine(1402)-2'-O)-methyltransferase [Candidatus Shapirobacteria bacterium CG03_land_8_20_14_0_80_35_14]PJA50796.1 MAG: 16S rRNA (cytidine(1402)-2'-O)-methyltransferase [Candidatus Shapirobacteria bacterium CG_4_9_14_3_um_filter_36_12]